MDGEPLAAEHGFPLRIVAPGWAGVRSPKWLTAVAVQDRPSAAHQRAADHKLFPPDMRPDTEDPSRGITIEAVPLDAATAAPLAGWPAPGRLAEPWGTARPGPWPIAGPASAPMDGPEGRPGSRGQRRGDRDRHTGRGRRPAGLRRCRAAR